MRAPEEEAGPAQSGEFWGGPAGRNQGSEALQEVHTVWAEAAVRNFSGV